MDGLPTEGINVTEDEAWDGFVAAAKAWAEYLDQWDKFKFPTRHGPVYVTIGREDLHPDTFEEIDGQPSVEG